MLIKLKYLSRYLVCFLLLPLVISCNQVGANLPEQFDAGNLVLSNNTGIADVVLGGTHQYTLSIVNMQNLKTPIAITISNSNNKVATIESNTCANPIDPSSYDLHKKSCSFYVRGDAIGNTELSIITNNYPTITVPLTIDQQWGTFGGVTTFDRWGSATPGPLSFNGDNVYVYANPYNAPGGVLTSQGGSWVEWGGEFGGSIALIDALLVSDDIHVCAITLNHTPDYIVDDYFDINCSTNGANWKKLPDINQDIIFPDKNRWEILKLSLRQGTIYAIADNSRLGQRVFSCNVDDCTVWQTSAPLKVALYNRGIIFESEAYLEDKDSVYYQSSDGNWQIYGSYSKDGEYKSRAMVANSSGVALDLSLTTESIPTDMQQIFYKSKNNMGGEFLHVGSIHVGSREALQMVIEKDTIYIKSDGNVYSSAKLTDKEWTPFTRIGQNNPRIDKIYVHNNKLYATTDNNHQIYVYSLSK